MRCGQHTPSTSGDDTFAGKGTLTELGRSYVDRITGFHGVATAKTIFIEGRAQTQLTPSAGFSPRTQPEPSVPPEWFEDARLALIPSGKITINRA